MTHALLGWRPRVSRQLQQARLPQVHRNSPLRVIRDSLP